MHDITLVVYGDVVGGIVTDSNSGRQISILTEGLGITT